MRRRRLTHTHAQKHSRAFNLALRSRTGAACNLLISGQRRPLFVCLLPVPLRHWRLCALSLPAADREGGSARRAGSQRRLSALCLSEGKCSHPNGSQFSSHTPCTPSPKLKTLPWRGGAGGRARTSSDRSGRRSRRGSDLIRGAGLHGGLQPGGGTSFLPLTFPDTERFPAVAQMALMHF